MSQVTKHTATFAKCLEKDVLGVRDPNYLGLPESTTCPSRGQDKDGKLETHFSSKAHAAALRDCSHFVCEDKHVDKLLTKAQRESLIDSKSQLCNNREVVEMLFDVVKVLTRNGLALRGCESSSNHSDGNF